jgi:hypothetical protein
MQGMSCLHQKTETKSEGEQLDSPRRNPGLSASESAKNQFQSGGVVVSDRHTPHGGIAE